MKQILRIVLVLVASMQLARAAAAGAWANQAQVSTAAQTNFLMLLVGNTGTTNDNALMSVANMTSLIGGVGASPNYPGAFVIDDAGPKWLNPRNYMVFYEDFNGNISPIVNASVGASATWTFNQPLDTGHFGIWRAMTGTTSTGTGCGAVGLNASFMCFGSGVWVMEALINLELASDDTEDYIFRWGFGDALTGGAPADGAFFRYNDNVNSGNWQCITANNSTYTTNNTAVAATFSTTGGAWTRLNVAADAAGANIIFSINGTSVATNSANIPITVARATAPYIIMQKTLGTTTRVCDVDYWTWFYKPTTPR